MDLLPAVVVYGGSLLLVALVILSIKEGREGWTLQPPAPWTGNSIMNALSDIALWAMVLSLLFAGLVDFAIWATKNPGPSVSDKVHYYLNLYPFVGWIIAGLVYHLLVDRPAPPLP